jgi:hypothetical protein
MTADEIAVVLRELGSGLALAKLADPAAIPDRLFGDFVKLFFELIISRQQPRPSHAIGGRRAGHERKPHAEQVASDHQL